MMLPRVSLRSFLSTAKSALNDLQQASPVTFVIGNESADLDSLCSAVVLAYLRTYTSTSKPNTLYIPLSNIPRADLSLRTELIPVLSSANLKPSDLITLSDLPSIKNIASRLPPEQTRWILVDHNALNGELGKIYGKQVIGCIDHHDEEGVIPQECGDEPRVVRKSGSCSTLVVENCRAAWDALSTNSPPTEETTTWNVELAQMALGPILIDTSNLTSKAVTTPADIEAAAYLEAWIASGGRGKFDRDVYFRLVSDAKQHAGDLSLPDILRKDYKQWTESNSMDLGVSSVVKGIGFMIEKAGSEEDFCKALKAFAEERDLSIMSLMAKSNPGGEFKRELLVWAVDEKGVAAAKKFEADSKETLGLQQWNEGSLDLNEDKQWRRCWWQERVENSRKQVAPLLRAAIGDVV